MKICFATHNQNKLIEVSQILNPVEVIGLDELGITEDIPETGKTLDENAIIKAKHVWDKLKINCFADDTGLEVKSLDGAPGVYSARYAGPDRNNDANIDLLLKNLRRKPDRSARFRTSICLILDGRQIMFDGIVSGQITEDRKGEMGFGYDPVFRPDGYDCTFAEMTMDQKNALSHRGRAIKKLADYLQSLH